MTKLIGVIFQSRLHKWSYSRSHLAPATDEPQFPYGEPPAGREGLGLSFLWRRGIPQSEERHLPAGGKPRTCP